VLFLIFCVGLETKSFVNRLFKSLATKDYLNPLPPPPQPATEISDEEMSPEVSEPNDVEMLLSSEEPDVPSILNLSNSSSGSGDSMHSLSSGMLSQSSQESVVMTDSSSSSGSSKEENKSGVKKDKKDVSTKAFVYFLFIFTVSGNSNSLVLSVEMTFM